jgi:photosystem II stability/assembly factor-like uncharacterized protein
MKKISFFVLAVLLLVPMSISATESDEPEETMEALSNDGTGTWTAVNSGLTNTHVTSLAIDPSNPDIIYAGTQGGLFKSINGGASWSDSGLTNVDHLVIAPSNPNIIYAGGIDGLFKSTDAGGHWSQISAPDARFVGYSIAIDPTNPNIVYGGNSLCVAMSVDGGGNWTCGGPGGAYALVIDPKNTSTIYAGTYGNGVYTYTGGAWNVSSTGLTNAYVTSLAINPTNTSIIYAGTDGGVFKSTDGGASWNAINSGLTNTKVTSLAIDPSDPSTIYAGTNGGVFESTDKGANWSAINSGLTNTHVTSLAIDPSNPDIIYAGTDGGGVFKLSSAEGPPSLHVSKAGTGDGTVTSTPPGIDCGSTCTASYTEETSVTLTATPSSGSVFAGWSGACSGTGDCVLTMDSNKSVTATFNLEGGYSVTVVKAGTGDGTVTSSPAGISCGSACSQAFQKITKVKLTAKANSDSIFTGWSGGGYSGTKPCQVTVDHAIAITASFDKKVSHISVSLNSLDFGSVKMGKSLKKTLKIINNGTGDLSVSIGGLGGTDFSVAGKTSITVKPNKSYSLGITFKPGSTGDKTATLALNSNDPDAPVISIPLTGTGI